MRWTEFEPMATRPRDDLDLTPGEWARLLLFAVLALAVIWILLVLGIPALGTLVEAFTP